MQLLFLFICQSINKTYILKNKLLLLAFVALTLSSCLSDLNLNPDTDFRYTGNVAAPIVHARLNLGNLVLQDSLTYADPDGLVHIIYREDSLFSQNVYDYTRVPDQDPTETEITVGNPDISIITNLGTFGGAKMKSITVNTGRLEWETTNPANDTVQIRVKLLYTDLNGQPANFMVKAAPGTSSGTIFLWGLNFDLTQGTLPYNNLGFELGIVDTTVVPNGTKIDLSLQFKNFGIESAIGYFGDREIDIPSNVIPFNLSVLDNLSGGLYLADPQIKLFTRSNIGLPVEIAPELIGVNANGKSVDLALQPFQFSGPSILGNYNQDTVEINNGNSQISNFIANVPSSIIYYGNVKLNPAGETQVDNFITSDGELTVGLEVDLPLILRTKNLTIEQTIYNIDLGVKEGEEDLVKSLSLGFRVENAFPLEADLHFYFQDSTGTVLDSAFVSMFDAANIDQNGIVISPAKSDRYLHFTEENIKTILKSDDIRIKVVLATSNGGNDNVRLLTDYYFDVIVGVKAKLNANLND